MGFVDAHAHLNDERFSEDREEVIANLSKEDICGVIVPGADFPSSESAYEMAKANPMIYCAVGTHPHDAMTLTREHLERYRELSRDPKCVAIGEIGLDYYYDHSPRAIQQEAFRLQMDLAKSLRLPVIIHTRDAWADTLAILEEYSGAVIGMMHCYTGSVEMAKRFMDLGYWISIGGPVTFKNANKVREMAKEIPLERLMIETDSPYLAPHPYRGKRNEPKYVVEVAKVLSSIMGVSLEEIRDRTRENVNRLFGCSL